MSNKAVVTKVGEREIRVERTFNASRDRVWKAMTDPALVAQWWGRGHKVVVEKYEFRAGGHWRLIEHSPDGPQGFEGRFGEIEAPSRVVRTFEWDGLPAHVALETMTLDDLGGERTKLVTTSLFHIGEDRDGMFATGVEHGINESYTALDTVLAASK